MHFWSEWTAFHVGHLPHFKRSSNLSKACLELFPLVSNANTDLCINIYLHIRSLQRTDAATWEIHLQASDDSPATGNWSASAIASLSPSLSFILSVCLSPPTLCLLNFEVNLTHTYVLILLAQVSRVSLPAGVVADVSTRTNCRLPKLSP